MKFCDKLAKLRKKNNFSQEQLAEKLEMSRQAISKWESGSSYPDMATIMKLCKILNCSLDELIDDDAMGNNEFTKNNKFNINLYMKDLLNFITKTYNMFCSMKFKDKIKCMIEMGIIVIILLLGFAIIGAVLAEIAYPIGKVFPYAIRTFFGYLLGTIYKILAIALGIIITIHLFKIRYLDYFVTVEDKNIKEKKIEKPIEEVKQKINFENKKEKVIIRDPKHSTYSFFSGIGKIMMFCIKCFVVVMAIPTVMAFVGICFGTITSFIWLKYGAVFLGIFISGIGALLVGYLVLEAEFKIVFNLKHKLTRIFILFMIGLVLVGTGIAVSVTSYLSFTPVDNKLEENETVIETMDIEMEDDLIINEINNKNVELVIDNTLEDTIKLEVKHANKSNLYVHYHYISSKFERLSIYSEFNFVEQINTILNDLKDKKARMYRNDDAEIVKIYISEDNLETIKNNIKGVQYYYDYFE